MINSKKKNKRIIISSLIFSILFSSIIFGLFAMPTLFITEKIVLLLYLSVLLLIALIIAIGIFFFFTRRIRRRKKVLKKDFPKNMEIILKKKVAYYSSLDNNDKKVFQKEVQIFLNEVEITGIDTTIDNTIKVLVAASAIIPIFRYPEWEYDSLGEVLIYPDNFNDEYNFNAKSKNILGLVTNGGTTMILSKSSLLHGFNDEKDKLNVGIHEFAHKIDGEDGHIDGIPSLLIKKSDVSKWLDLVKEESDNIKNKKSDINPYALTNNAEFFAVVSEYFFENPQVMARKHKKLYEFLKKIFKQDTRSMFIATFNAMLRSKGKKIKDNSLCPCGSGKKYKNCCKNKKNK